MVLADHRLEEAHASLCRILREPHAFGLGDEVPPLLAAQLERTRALLSGLLDVQASEASGDDPEEALFQDR